MEAVFGEEVEKVKLHIYIFLVIRLVNIFNLKAPIYPFNLYFRNIFIKKIHSKRNKKLS